jgi:carbonic anhydrase/acetyltransferase-like protein (isoleucine patch superfamily)
VEKSHGTIRHDRRMLVEHRGKRPTVHPSAWVAPTAVVVGDDVLIGPQAHVNGSTIGREAFIATRAALFPGSRIGVRAEVRIGGVVHVNSTVADGGVVPIGWVAVGDQILPPERHEDIWAIQEGLDFPGTVYGEPRGEDLMARVMPRQSAWLAHRDDRVL